MKALKIRHKWCNSVVCMACSMLMAGQKELSSCLSRPGGPRRQADENLIYPRLIDTVLTISLHRLCLGRGLLPQRMQRTPLFGFTPRPGIKWLYEWDQRFGLEGSRAQVIPGVVKLLFGNCNVTMTSVDGVFQFCLGIDLFTVFGWPLFLQPNPLSKRILIEQRNPILGI